MPSPFALLALIASIAAPASAKGYANIPGASSYNGLNLVPQMGWDDWNAFGCNVNETLLFSTAQTLVSTGLRDLGYKYVILDDCWSSGRNSSGYLEEDREKFPRGLAPLISDIHALGLKFGIYSSAGIFTCGRYPGSLDHEEKDAALWASWGVDYVKYDNCFNQGRSGTPEISFKRYEAMSKALNATGRSVVYAICNWGNDDPFDWAYTISNSWRMSGDIYDSFNRPDSRCPCDEAIGCRWPGFHCSVMNILNKMAAIQARSMSGAFNDMDMLEVGNGGQDDNEYVTHFSMWALLSSPLLLGTNLATLSPANLAILSNPAVIALNQDPSAGAAIRKWRYLVADKDANGQGEISLWTRVMDNGDTVVALVNAGNAARSMNATLADIFLDQSTGGTYRPAEELATNWEVWDLWGGRMAEAEARAVIESGPSVSANSTMRYNASAVGYAEGLKANHPALFGTKVGTVAPHGTLTAQVARHSVGLFRLRKVAGMRDEL
ncbi:glycoside hydrolase [Trichodelitschia bisporula]|uniref:Alpha-galactosidase n=1 Tax=Trichodelitschia bisporula TaxID=703511 RepID=A0A6G1HLQ6_9PEZI|nr:glycoside hydrolase [Trichodelitschia bisporula]